MVYRHWRPTRSLCHRIYLFLFIFLFYLFERRQGKRGRGREREREREPQAGSTLSTDPNRGLDPMTLGSWPESKSRVRHSTNLVTQAQNLNKSKQCGFSLPCQGHQLWVRLLALSSKAKDGRKDYSRLQKSREVRGRLREVSLSCSQPPVFSGHTL